MSSPITIAHYRITSKLGEGGMGAVYRATDTKLNREVAVKVLPPAFAEDAARMARFEREAQVLASLNHPNIAAIYGIEEGALVMELVEGEDLHGPVPVDTAIAYARQIAAGLDAAHEKGIVHRDLKPANIKVTPDGTVKLLDFGLAKATEPASGASKTGSPTLSPTLSLAMTQAGIILGTAAYMSPEQARGKPVDKRADIWAFGVVLYELLSGNTLFGDGETVSDAMAAVITREPDWSALPADTPVRVRRVLEQCLRKDPRQRLRDIGDARLALDEPEPVVAAPASPRAGRPWGWVAAGVLALALAGVMLAPRPVPLPPLRPLLRFEDDLVPDARGGLALSADGSRVVYKITKGGGTQLVTRLLDQPEAVPIPGTENSLTLALSPNGDWVVFGVGNQLRKAPLHGGPSITLSELGSGVGVAWGDDGNIVFAPTIRSQLFQLPSGGGNAQAVTRMDDARKEVTHRNPWLLPGGKVVLFVAADRGGAYDSADIVAQNLETGQRRVLHHGGFHPRYLPGPDGKGYLLFAQQSTIFATPLNPANLEVREPPVPMLAGVASDPGGAMAEFAVSTTGIAVYRPGTNADANALEWIDAAGNTRLIREEVGDYSNPRISPDGKRVAYQLRTNAGYDLWVTGTEGGPVSRLTFDGRSGGPAWTPDGRHLAFLAGGNLFWLRSDGSGQPHIASVLAGTIGGFTPDGHRLLVTSNRPDTKSDILALPLNDPASDDPKPGNLETILATPATERFPSVSPNGKWLAYNSDETGTNEVYVRSFPNLSGKWQVSQGGGGFPVWSPHGSELFFATPGTTMSVTYAGTGDAFTHSVPKVWSRQPIYSRGQIDYSAAPDGKHLAAVLPPAANEGVAPTRLVFLVNFVDEVQRKVAQATK